MRIIRTSSYCLAQYKGEYKLDWEPEDVDLDIPGFQPGKKRELFNLMENPGSGDKLVSNISESWPPAVNEDPELRGELFQLSKRLDLPLSGLISRMVRDSVSLQDPNEVREWINRHLREPR